MDNFRLHILGCGSASPSPRHMPSCQVVEHRSKLFMIDCGEGAQLQMMKMRLKFGKLNHVFLSLSTATNSRMTLPATPSASYAYCTDTAAREGLTIDLLDNER